METPSFFPLLSLLPMRAMTYIKSSYPSAKYEDVFGELWIETWQRHNELSAPEKMAACLSRHFDAEDVKKIMAAANTPAIKQELLDVTKKALDSGAFGCPWFVVTNKEGKVEPFFGSDR
jgi:glutathione S-transferase kappa 1